MAHLFVNGTHLVLHGINGDAGDANGLAKVTVEVNVPDLATVFSLDPSAVAATLGLGAVRCVSRPFKQDADEEFTVTFNFEGINDGETTFEQSEAKATHELDTSFGETGIKTHPFLDELKAKYGWDDKKDEFPEFAPDKTGSDKTGLSGGAKKQKRSDLAGANSWMVIGAIFRRTVVARFAPANLLEGIGEPIAKPPGLDRLRVKTPKGRNWLTLPPKISEHGADGAVTIVYEWMLSGPRGWNRDVYRFGQLNT